MDTWTRGRTDGRTDGRTLACTDADPHLVVHVNACLVGLFILAESPRLLVVDLRPFAVLRGGRRVRQERRTWSSSPPRAPLSRRAHLGEPPCAPVGERLNLLEDRARRGVGQEVCHHADVQLVDQLQRGLAAVDLCAVPRVPRGLAVPEKVWAQARKGKLAGLAGRCRAACTAQARGQPHCHHCACGAGAPASIGRKGRGHARPVRAGQSLFFPRLFFGCTKTPRAALQQLFRRGRQRGGVGAPLRRSGIYDWAVRPRRG